MSALRVQVALFGGASVARGGGGGVCMVRLNIFGNVAIETQVAFVC